VSTHQFNIGGNHLGGLFETTVFGQSLKEVLCQGVGLTGLGKKGSDTLHLLFTVNGGVLEEGTDGLVGGDGTLKGLQVLLNGIKGALAGSSGEKGSGVTSIKTVKCNGSLKKEDYRRSNLVCVAVESILIITLT
jgi:hypothetical protein